MPNNNGGNNPPTLKIQEVLNKRHDERLMSVITLAEAEYLTGVSRNRLIYAIHQNRISARFAITGGTILVQFDSLIRIFPVLPERKVDLAWIG